MTCKKYERLLVSYLDDELSEKDRKEVEDHIGSCPVCKEQARRLGLGLEVFRSIEAHEPATELSPYLPARIAARAVEARRSQRLWRLRFGFAFGAMTLVLGLFIGYIVGPRIPVPGGEGARGVASIRLESEGTGFVAEGDHFILHSKDKRGERGIDLKF